MQALGRSIHLVDTEYPQSCPVCLWRKKATFGWLFSWPCAIGRVSAALVPKPLSDGWVHRRCILSTEGKPGKNALMARSCTRVCAGPGKGCWMGNHHAARHVQRGLAGKVVHSLRANGGKRAAAILPRVAGHGCAGWGACCEAFMPGMGRRCGMHGGAVQERPQKERAEKAQRCFFGLVISGARGWNRTGGARQARGEIVACFLVARAVRAVAEQDFL